MKYFSNIDILYMIRIRIVQGLLILSLILKNIFLLNLTFDLSLRSSFDLKRTRKFEFFFNHTFLIVSTYKSEIKPLTIYIFNSIINDRNMTNTHIFQYFLPYHIIYIYIFYNPVHYFPYFCDIEEWYMVH